MADHVVCETTTCDMGEYGCGDRNVVGPCHGCIDNGRRVVLDSATPVERKSSDAIFAMPDRSHIWREIPNQGEQPMTINPTFEFDTNSDGSIDLETAVYQALGAASLCWEHIDRAGVFQSDRAKQIGEELIALIYREEP